MQKSFTGLIVGYRSMALVVNYIWVKGAVRIVRPPRHMVLQSC